MMLIVLLPCIVTVCLGTPLQKESFRGHKVLGVEAKDASQVELLRQLEINDIELDFWSEPSLGGRTDFRVKPKDLQRIEATLNRAGLEWKIVNQDVQESIDEEARAMATVRQSRASVSYRDTYLTFEEIISTLQNLADQYSDRVTLSTYGYSYEGRDLIEVKVSKNDGISRPAIWVESLTHAREWVTGSVALYIIEELASQSSINAKYMLDMYDWYFSPVHNPDGYVYTHTTNRMWRKNRRPISKWCTGVDLNRNWDSHFGVTGSSTNACADTYRGPNSFSEPETSAFAAAVGKTPHHVAFFSFHAYSQLLLLPYAHGQSEAPNIDALRTMSDNAMQELKGVHGKTYEVGIPKEILYAASGGAYDYMMERGGISYSFTYELRPATATPGFELPPSEIMPTCEEVWASLFSYTQQIAGYKK